MDYFWSYQRSSKLVLRAILAYLFVFALLVAPAVATFAQTDVLPSLRITKIDNQLFPLVTVTVYGENLGSSLSDVPLQLYENGTERQITASDMQPAGIQVALVLDAAGNMNRPGRTNNPQLQEFKDTVDHIAKSGLLTEERDWVTFISFDQAAKPVQMNAWEDYDYQAVWNSVILYELPEGVGTTPLFDLIRAAVQRFADPVLPAGQEKHVLVFSDGTDIVSVLESEQVVGLARENNVRIHTIQLGRANTQAERNLRQISELTGGEYVALDSIDSIDGTLDIIEKTANQRALTYRSELTQPGEIRVQAQLPGDKKIAAGATLPGLTLLPPAVSLLQPTPGSVIERTGGEWDTPLEQLSPSTVAVQPQFEWPDGHPRVIEKIEIDLGNKTEVITEAPFDRAFSIPVEKLGNGEYTLRVRAIDELGLIGTSQPVNLFVSEARPAAPTATPIPSATPSPTPTPNATATKIAALSLTATATADAGRVATISNQGELIENLTTQTRQLSLISIASAGLAVLALGFAIYVLSSRDRRKRATEIITGAVRTVTEPFVRTRMGSTSQRAQLVLVENGGTVGLPAAIPLQDGIIRIGRDPSVSNVLLDDRRVSRLHCQIKEEQGGYRIYDEGSTSGTYINDVEVGMHGQMLKPDDRIGIGPTVYRFELQQAAGASPDSTTRLVDGRPGDITQPFVPRQGP